MKRLFKIIGWFFGILLLLIIIGIAYIKWGMAPEIPKVENDSALGLKREKMSENFYRIGNNWLRKNKYGLWEEYVEGAPFERGVITGKLEKELLYSQEVAFVEQIHRLVPNNTYLSFLALFTRVFNRDLDDNFPEENKLEIYGESFSAPEEFNYISPAYDRMLNYHAAHDIGHALQSLALVGCTSFSAWGSHTNDSSLIVARNLDFYLGEKFARDKIVYFCKPKNGHKFAMITWAGFMGCVSGMNEKGITVTINAAKSDVPNGAKTPISILAREILQYAKNIDEAYAIAKKRKTFVCETIMIGSAEDHRTALIEKSVNKIALVNSDTNYIICSNHYQSDSFANDLNNVNNKKESNSVYRYQRAQELLNENAKLDFQSAASILRNQKGLHDENLGTGNEMALNQLISHHGIIFQPEKLQFWVSANPYQLGEFVCYDLNKIFSDTFSLHSDREISEDTLHIPVDTFLLSQQWKFFLLWRDIKLHIKEALENDEQILSESMAAQFISYNPEYWETYSLLAQYAVMTGDKSKATTYYRQALTKKMEVAVKNEIEKSISELK